ncbi:cytochrome P450 716B1-like [Iris pallida]|uniref:Cytochrome P450 716B1-like n=1 Tax=Iris pallida TaxID=29817 RepID=A0AAX6H3G4_IRIPA|nr:cytochrome P450 716B1-like [Iris pallida]KAJ6835015.1 cytochrome P450 716B1-like [Iris pallida]
MTTLLVIIVAFFLPMLFLLARTTRRRRTCASKLPPGPMGIPILGDNLGFLLALWTDRLAEWAGRRVDKYGPVSKLSLFGAPTVLLAGPAASKFVFTSDAFVSEQLKPFKRMIGERTITQLAGGEHRRLRGAIAQFLRLDMMKKYVGRVDEEVRHHIAANWAGRDRVTVVPLAKSLSLDLIGSLVYDIDSRDVRNRLKRDFVDIMDGLWADGIGLPFLNLNRTTRACARVRGTLTEIVRARREAHEQGRRSSKEDLITYLISLESRDPAEDHVFVDDEIIDISMLVMLAGYDTSSVLITFMIRHLANDPPTRAAVVREQEEIANSKASKEDPLTWDDVAKMKYTWRVAMEILRMIPPLFGARRTAVRDVEYDGYTIPKGWNALWLASVTQMDATIFPEPAKFDPTRFENPSIPAYSFQAFGGGLHACPGNEFARLETLVTMHYLVTRFDWKLCCKPDGLRRNPSPSPTKGLPIRLEPRI